MRLLKVAAAAALAAAFLLPASGHAQGVYPFYGAATPGHLPVLQGNFGSTVSGLRDAGTAATGSCALNYNCGITDMPLMPLAPGQLNGTFNPLSIYDNQVSAGNYHFWNFGYVNGVPTITAGSSGTASPIAGINLNIGGSVVTLPGSASCIGCGTIVGQNANSVAITGGAISGLSSLVATVNTTSPMTADSSQILGTNTTGFTAAQIYEGAIGPGSGSATGNDAVRGVLNYTSGSTTITGTGVAGYTVNNAVSGVSANQTASLFGVAISNVDHSSSWGIDTICTDHLNQVVSTGVGRACFDEFDFNMTSTGSTAGGLLIGGTWLAQPTSATGVTILKPNGTGAWQYAFGDQDGASTTTFARIGADAASGTSVNSQSLDFHYFDGSSVAQTTSVAANASGLLINSTGSAQGGLVLAGSGSINMTATGSSQGFLRVVTSGGANFIESGLANAGGSTAPLNFTTIGATATIMELQSTLVTLGSGVGLVFSTLNTGSPVASLCVDAGGNVIKKTTSGSCI